LSTSDTTNVATVPALQVEVEQLRRWCQNQDRQIRFLEQERKKLSALVNHTDAGFVVIGPDFKVVWANKVFCEWFDCADAADGRSTVPYGEIVCWEGASLDTCPCARAFESGMVAHEEIKLEINGEDRHMYATAMPIASLEGEVDEVIVMLQDITDLEVLRRSQTALRNAKDEAESANRAKSEFLANMSHEVRTPMTGVIGMTGLLVDSELTDEQRQYVKIIQTSAHSLLVVLNDILDFSKIEAGKLMIEPIPFDLGLAIDEVVELMVEKADENNIELIMRIAPDVPQRVIGDPGRIRQVLINLVSNAIKFTHEGHVFINVNAVETTSESARIAIAVEDTGIGVPADKRKEIFEKFTQADGSVTRKYGGTGLGLAISKQLVELMGGTIHLTTRPDVGSTFTFVLDLPLQRSGPAEALPTASLDGVRVLTVHPHEVVRRVLVEQTVSWGARGEAVATGAAAIDVIRAAAHSGDRIEIAIVSYDMTDMGVEEFANRIKNDPVVSDVSLVMVTSVGQQGDAVRLKAAGFDAYVTRPTRPSQLLYTLATVWGVKQRGVQTVMITRHTLSELKQVRDENVSEPPDDRFYAHILLAEDNETTQHVLAKVLESLGYRVDIVSNGREAIYKLEHMSYDAVIMDCQMPEMDGLAATRAIREREKGSDEHIPIIALTANALAEQRLRCLEAGMDEYLTKPARKEILREALSRHVGQQTA